MLIDLHGNRYGREPFSIKVELHAHALDHLIEDAKNAYRVYELFSIGRPGDIWKYIWIKLFEVPKRVEDLYLYAREKATTPYAKQHPWPENEIPLLEFDKFFFWCGDDTEPEHECWLREREGESFKQFVENQFRRIEAAKDELSNSRDTLIAHEVRTLNNGTHPLDYAAEPPFQRTRSDYASPTIPQRPEGYYAKLQELLALPEVQSVASRGNDDYQTIKAMCAEQGRRADRSKKIPCEAFPISMLSDFFPTAKAWGAEILFCMEGLGDGDLWIEQHRCHGATIKELAEEHHRVRPVVLCHEDEGEIQGYARTVGNGWVLYRAEPSNEQLTEWDPATKDSRQHKLERERMERSQRGARLPGLAEKTPAGQQADERAAGAEEEVTSSPSA